MNRSYIQKGILLSFLFLAAIMQNNALARGGWGGGGAFAGGLVTGAIIGTAASQPRYYRDDTDYWRAREAEERAREAEARAREAEAKLARTNRKRISQPEDY